MGLEGKPSIMMEVAKGRADLDVSKHHLSGINDFSCSNSAHEVVMEPVTPLPDRENQTVSSPSSQSEEAIIGSACHTPTESAFDPFAPGPEGLMFAPRKKMLKNTFMPIRRQLNFGCGCQSKENSEDCVLEEVLEEEGPSSSVYRPFLDASVSPSVPLSEEIADSDANRSEGKPSIGREDTEGGEDMDPCESYFSKFGISGVDDTCLPKKVDEAVIGPLTPFLEGQNLEVSTSSDQTDRRDLLSGCQTPGESTFDPFAPAPEVLMFAPKKKSLMERHVPVQRKLNFGSCCDSEDNLVGGILEENSEEEIFLATVYKSFLDVIITCQVSKFTGEGLLADSTGFDGLRTPTSSPLLNGIAETCPGAPVRPKSKSRKLSVSICRKLEF